MGIRVSRRACRTYPNVKKFDFSQTNLLVKVVATNIGKNWDYKGSLKAKYPKWSR
jgi:hypothetical protein